MARALARYLKAAFRPIRSYAKYSARLAKASAAGERVVELLDEIPEIRDTASLRGYSPFWHLRAS